MITATDNNSIYTTNLMKVLVGLYADTKVVQYLALKLSGASNKEIRNVLGISANTLSTYTNRYAKDLEKLQ